MSNQAPLNWQNDTIRLGDLKPWADNPRMSTKAQAERIIKSFVQFNQVQPFSVSPDNDLYDGHQRLGAILALQAGKYRFTYEAGTPEAAALEILRNPDTLYDCRRANRPLDDAERRALVLALHNATGAWDWNALAGWDAELLQDNGFDEELLKTWNSDALNLREFIGAEITQKAWSVSDENNYSDPGGDGVELKAGYRLSSIWYGMTRENEIRKYMLDLPQRPSVSNGATVKLKYSRTNAEETERIIKTYMRPGDTFFEMCCGWMTFSSTAKYLGFDGTGGDIWDVSLDFCEKQLRAMPGDGKVNVKYADCRKTEEPSEKYNFVHSNPPFFSLEPYGDSGSNLASLGSYERWLDAMGDMGAEAERILKPGGIANFVINDFRKGGELIPMHADFINAIKSKSNLILHDFVIAEVISQALRFRKHDYERRRTVKCHEYIITFRKKDNAPTD